MNWEQKRDSHYQTNGFYASFEQQQQAKTGAKPVPPKPVKKTYSCYEEERFDLVQTELALELSKDSPNWVYAEALNRESLYWKQRWNDSKPVYKSLFDLWGF